MGTKINNTCKRQRALGEDLGFKTSPKKQCRPNRSGTRRSDYGEHLLEKQKLRDKYLLSEKQFRNLYKKAKRNSGDTAENLLQSLEMRLDNVVYSLGFAATRREAQQMISHGHIEVQPANLVGKEDKKITMQSVTIKSYQVLPGQVVAVKASARSHLRVKAAMELAASRSECEWFENNDHTGSLKAAPTIDQMPLSSREGAYKVIELYSR